MTKQNYIYGQLLQVFLHLLDDDEKRKAHIVKINDALRRKLYKPKANGDKLYYECADIIEKAMVKSWDEIPNGKNITINAICWLIQNRHSETLKPYKLNRKHFETMSRLGVSGFALESAKVLNLIEKYINELLKESDV
ncbi:MAG TPA: hypothetical protein VFM18_22400 [Methanosarcina sp.]|nr:hypothetical protein [Methanosarcina sp.]